VPFLQLISKKMKRDAQGFGKYRGGMGYEIAVAARGTPLWGFATVSSGSKFPAIPGLFGGYGCPTYPLAKIKGVNVFEVLRSAPETWSFDYETLMNSRPFADARYSTHHMGMGFELADEGEVYMICQGTGGGYGDVLERDPEAVMTDVEAGYLSSETAREIYFVVHDPGTLAVDTAGTEAARATERQARLRRGRPYGEFVTAWTTPEPPAHLPYYGSWGDDNSIIHATAWTTHGPVRVAAPASQLPQIFLPDPNVIALAVQQARIAELETRLHELEGRLERP
jgi:acetone carboxylase alpha subunit